MITRESSRASALRCLLVLATVTAAIAGLIGVLADELSGARELHGSALTQLTFDEVLVRGAAVLLTACLLWFWLVTLTSCLEAATTVRVGIGPRHWRRLILAACGFALVAGGSPAIADTTNGQPRSPSAGDQHALAGLSLPDRAKTPDPVRAQAQASTDRTTTIRVRSGDTLWGLARARLPAQSTDAEVAVYWRATWQLNRSSIGTDPDLIRPGTILHLPSLTKEK